MYLEFLDRSAPADGGVNMASTSEKGFRGLLSLRLLTCRKPEEIRVDGEKVALGIE